MFYLENEGKGKEKKRDLRHLTGNARFDVDDFSLEY